MKQFISKYQDHLIFFSIFLIAFLWKIPYLGVRDLALDEPFTLYHSQKSVWGIIQRCTEGPNAPLFMILVHFWSKVVGFGEEGLRLLPLFFHSLSIGITYLIGKRFFGLWAGILGAGLMLFSSYHFYFSMELRMYGLMVFFTSLSLLFFLKCLEENHKKDAWWLLLSNVLLVYTHYFGWFVIFIQALTVLLYFQDKQKLKSIFLVITGTAVAFLPLALVLVNQFIQSKEGGWIAPPNEDSFRIQLHAFLNSGMVLRLMNTFFIPIGLSLAFLMGRLFSTPKKYLAVLLWWIVPMWIMFQVSFEIPMFIDRYILFNSVGVFVFFGAFIHRFAWVNWLRGILVVVLIIHMYRSFESGGDYYRREIKSAVEEVKAVQNTDNLVLLSPGWSQLNFAYHYDLEVFKEGENLEQLLEQKGVYTAWDVETVRKLLKEKGNRELIIFTNGSIYNPMTTTLIGDLKQTYTITKQTEYPLNLCVWRLNPKTSETP